MDSSLGNEFGVYGNSNIPQVEGFRHIYVDELQMGSKMFTEMRKQIAATAIVWVINGWTEGS